MTCCENSLSDKSFLMLSVIMCNVETYNAVLATGVGCEQPSQGVGCEQPSQGVGCEQPSQGVGCEQPSQRVVLTFVVV